MKGLTIYHNNPAAWFDDFFENGVYYRERPRNELQWEIEENEGHYLMRFDLPGVKKDDVKIEVHGDVLSVTGERKDIRNKENYQSYGVFKKTFTLPDGVDSEKIEANLEDGVLRLAIPKLAERQPKQIKIGIGEKSSFFSKLLGQKEKLTDEPAA